MKDGFYEVVPGSDNVLLVRNKTVVNGGYAVKLNTDGTISINYLEHPSQREDSSWCAVFVGELKPGERRDYNTIINEFIRERREKTRGPC
jgi:hypothetical protein